ncbi:MAG TPA: hypothetical protein VN181_01185 [Thermoanaerobaculia bacterium]|nr:hypothetical protein [Thermoanaerobaculia bacterium]
MIGAVDAAVAQGAEEAAAGAKTGRRIGIAVGLVSAIFGGAPYESIDESIARYRAARDTGEAIGAIAGGAHGANAGARRGFQFDLEMAELKKFDDLDVTRPAPDELIVQFTDPATPRLADIARIVGGRRIFIEAPGDTGIAVRDALIDHGVAASTLQSHRNDKLSAVRLRILGDL